VLDCFAVCAPGLEALVAAELTARGLKPGRIERGGVPFRATTRGLYAANVWLRTASRVLVRTGRFRATTFADLVRHAEALPWDRYLAPGTPVSWRVSSHRSRLYHTGAIAERLAPIAERLGAPEQPVQPVQPVVVRIVQDLVTISVDSSGEHLHRRGWRLAGAKAPLRETLAAAMVLASGWDGVTSFVDPLCGSGTVAIEAALFAQGLAPGRARRFAFHRWPSFEPGTWASVAGELRAADDGSATRPAPIIVAADRDEGAARATRENAERAGVAPRLDVRRASFSETAQSIANTFAGAPGWLVTNPPYGTRVRGGDLRDLYASLGAVAQGPLAAWHVGLLVADRALAGHTRLDLDTRFVTSNGGIPVTFAARAGR
jgi:putative N6-adenine-specific DNA methylase